MKSTKSAKSVRASKKACIDSLTELAVAQCDLQNAQGMGAGVILTTNWQGFFDGSLFKGPKGERRFNEFDIIR